MAISSSKCSCGLAHLERIPRRSWMRWLPWLRYYQCTLCGGRRLATENAVNAAVAARASREAVERR